ncbi:MAG: hypothetical protein A6D91_12005 [Bacillaceae bacterium G1]|nr:MAG: hypothetical protein A6D91_12005 [Bacillaceae bacterium G1]
MIDVAASNFSFFNHNGGIFYILSYMERPRRRLNKRLWKGGQGMKVALFITCLADLFFPEVGKSVVHVLEGQGVEVDVPLAQTCCV